MDVETIFSVKSHESAVGMLLLLMARSGKIVSTPEPYLGCTA